MKIINEESLYDFEFWCGAKSTFKMLTQAEAELIEGILEELYPEGLTSTELNDIFWFDSDWIAEIVGYKDFDAMFADRGIRPLVESNQTNCPYLKTPTPCQARTDFTLGLADYPCDGCNIIE